jgi:chromosome segregation ATPase
MGVKSNLETAEAVKENLQEQIEQKMALIRQLELALKEIENQITAKRAELENVNDHCS